MGTDDIIREGASVGTDDIIREGAAVGTDDGVGDGAAVGADDGVGEGAVVGIDDGVGEGATVGNFVVGAMDGCLVAPGRDGRGLADGVMEGDAEGKVDGPADGAGDTDGKAGVITGAEVTTSSSPTARDGSPFPFSFWETLRYAATPTKTMAPTKSAVDTTMAVLSQLGASVNQRGRHPPAAALS